MSRFSYLIAGGLLLGAAGWLGSGMLEDGQAPAAPSRSEVRTPLVEVAQSTARPVVRYVTARGDVRSFRSVAARTQSAGRVAEILVDQGERVEQGQALVRLTLEGRDSRLREARAVLARRQQDYDAVSQLLDDGFTTASRVRELETLLQSAREEVQRLEEEVGDTTVKAPFAGVVDAVEVDPGEFLDSGADAVRLVDNSPLRTEVRVSQHDVGKIEVGRQVTVSYATGASETGRVCFISAAADPQTRTFRVEIRTPNAEGTIPSGISAETRIPTEEINAHFVSPAMLSLGTDGALGVKTVGDDGVVAFVSVEVVRAQTNGVWVSGISGEARIITIGQGFVQDGDDVRVSQSEAATGVPDPAARSGEPDAGAGQDGSVPADICDREPSDASTRQVAETGQQAQTGGSAPPPASEEQVELTGDAAAAAAQEALNGLGFDAGPVDGVMGERTREALRAFQQQNGLPATGNLDRASFDRLMGADAAGGPARRPGERS